MKKIIYTFFILSIFFINIEFLYAGEECKYKSEIEKCLEANKKGSLKSIKEFLCVSEIDSEKMIYNLILDDKFKKIDKEADKFWQSLEKDKDRFFGPEQEEPFLKGIDEIYEAYGVGGFYYNLYHDQLSTIRAETLECLGGKKTSINRIKDYFLVSNAVDNLILSKLSTRKKLSIDILKLNKQQIRKDSSKKLMQVRRTFYDTVSDLFMVNLGYLMRIAFKWPSKTKNPY